MQFKIIQTQNWKLDKQCKQETSLKSCKIEITIHANPGLA